MALLCNLLFLSAFTQLPVRQTLPVKPLLFGHLPDHTAISLLQLEQLFNSVPSQHIKIPMGAGSALEGVIAEKVVRNRNVTSVTIQCINYDGALFTISKITAGNATDAYVGRVVNIRYGDVLLLTRQNDQYMLSKQKQSLVVVE